jgi:SulP family sulfate permease
VAGVSLGAFVIPERLSHAHLAGVWPGVGLHSYVVAAVLYALFGRPRALVAGTDPSLAILMAGRLGPLAVRDPALAACMAALTALMAGLFGVAAWALRLGSLHTLMSRSVLVGFTMGAGLLVIGRQLPALCGLEAGSGAFLTELSSFLRRLSLVSWTDLTAGVVALALLALGDRFWPRWPTATVVLLLSLVVGRLAGLSGPVKLVATAPPGGVWLSLPWGALSRWVELVPLGAAVFLLSYAQDVFAIRETAGGRRDGVSHSRELLSNGATNVGAGLVGGMPVSASLPSSLSDEEAASTPLAMVVSGLVILAVLMFVLAPLRYLPEAMLSANLIRHAVKRWTWRRSGACAA